MKSDETFLDVKLVVITKDSAAWLDAVAQVGNVEHSDDVGGWAQRRVDTGAKLRDLQIRVTAWVGPPTADIVAAFVGADRIVSESLTEIPDVSVAEVPRVVGPPARETLLGALKEVLRDAAAK